MIKRKKIKKRIRNPIKKINQRKKVSNMLNINCPIEHLSHNRKKISGGRSKGKQEDEKASDQSQTQAPVSS